MLARTDRSSRAFKSFKLFKMLKSFGLLRLGRSSGKNKF